MHSIHIKQRRSAHDTSSNAKGNNNKTTRWFGSPFLLSLASYANVTFFSLSENKESEKKKNVIDGGDAITNGSPNKKNIYMTIGIFELVNAHTRT